MAHYTVDTVINAPRDLVYSLFADREHYGDFLPIKATLKTAGDTERQGVGSVHTLGAGPLQLVQEQITELQPGALIRYRIVAGAPVKSHTGDIVFSDADGGTRVRYSMESHPKLPVPAAAVNLALRGLITFFVNGIRKEAERRTNP